MDALRDELQRLQEQLRGEQRKPQVGCVQLELSCFMMLFRFLYL